MTIYAHDSANLKRSFFADICTICLNISATITTGIFKVCYPTTKYLSISSTVFNFNCLAKHNSPINHLFNTYLFP